MAETSNAISPQKLFPLNAKMTVGDKTGQVVAHIWSETGETVFSVVSKTGDYFVATLDENNCPVEVVS